MRKLFTSALLLFALSVLVVPQTLLGGAAKLGGQGVVRRAAAGGGTTLNDGLVSFWKLDEATDSATYVDTAGSNNLTRNGTPITSIAGKVGNASQFSGLADLSITDNASLSFTSSFTVALWVKFDSLPGVGNYKEMVNKADSGSTISYIVGYDGDLAGSNPLAFLVSSNGSATTVVNAATFGVPSTGVWYFIVTSFDDTANTIGISVNNGTVNTAAFTGNVFDSTSAFYLGNCPWLGQRFEIGSMDAGGIWSRVLATTEIGCLYNGGVGQEPPFAVCP